MRYLRAVIQPLVELQIRRDKDFVETLRLAESEEAELTTAQPR